MGPHIPHTGCLVHAAAQHVNGAAGVPRHARDPVAVAGQRRLHDLPLAGARVPQPQQLVGVSGDDQAGGRAVVDSGGDLGAVRHNRKEGIITNEWKRA